MLLGCFMAHYFHRAFVYPLVVQRGGKPTPAPVWLMALAFCTYNGLMQVQAHTGALPYRFVWLMALAFCTYNGLLQVPAHAGAQAACTKSVVPVYIIDRGQEFCLAWVH